MAAVIRSNRIDFASASSPVSASASPSSSPFETGTLSNSLHSPDFGKHHSSPGHQHNLSDTMTVSIPDDGPAASAPASSSSSSQSLRSSNRHHPYSNTASTSKLQQNTTASNRRARPSNVSTASTAGTNDAQALLSLSASSAATAQPGTQKPELVFPSVLRPNGYKAPEPASASASASDTSSAAAPVASSSTSQPAALQPIVGASQSPPPTLGPKPKVSHSRKVGPDHIKRPPNAFILFRSYCCAPQTTPATTPDGTEAVRPPGAPSAEQLSELGITNHSHISRIVSHLWKSLSNADKKYWADLAEEKKAEHARMYPDYQYKPVHRSDIRRRKHRDDEAAELERRTEVDACAQVAAHLLGIEDHKVLSQAELDKRAKERQARAAAKARAAEREKARAAEKLLASTSKPKVGVKVQAAAAALAAAKKAAPPSTSARKKSPATSAPPKVTEKKQATSTSLADGEPVKDQAVTRGSTESTLATRPNTVTASSSDSSSSSTRRPSPVPIPIVRPAQDTIATSDLRFCPPRPAAPPSVTTSGIDELDSDGDVEFSFAPNDSRDSVDNATAVPQPMSFASPRLRRESSAPAPTRSYVGDFAYVRQLDDLMINQTRAQTQPPVSTALHSLDRRQMSRPNSSMGTPSSSRKGPPAPLELDQVHRRSQTAASSPSVSPRATAMNSLQGYDLDRPSSSAAIMQRVSPPDVSLSSSRPISNSEPPTGPPSPVAGTFLFAGPSVDLPRPTGRRDSELLLAAMGMKRRGTIGRALNGDADADLMLVSPSVGTFDGSSPGRRFSLGRWEISRPDEAAQNSTTTLAADGSPSGMTAFEADQALLDLLAEQPFPQPLNSSTSDLGTPLNSIHDTQYRPETGAKETHGSFGPSLHGHNGNDSTHAPSRVDSSRAAPRHWKAANGQGCWLNNHPSYQQSFHVGQQDFFVAPAGPFAHVATGTQPILGSAAFGASFEPTAAAHRHNLDRQLAAEFAAHAQAQQQQQQQERQRAVDDASYAAYDWSSRSVARGGDATIRPEDGRWSASTAMPIESDSSSSSTAAGTDRALEILQAQLRDPEKHLSAARDDTSMMDTDSTAGGNFADEPDVNTTYIMLTPEQAQNAALVNQILSRGYGVSYDRPVA